MLIEKTVLIGRVTFTLSDPEVDLAGKFDSVPLGQSLPVTRVADKWIYRCKCGKYQTPPFVGKKDTESIPNVIEAGMTLHAENHG